MEKMKLLTVVLVCLGMTSVASATEVISIDLNGYNDANAYTGEGAAPGEAVWRAYYGGWGKAVGSPRSASLRDSDEPNLPSTYAAQVWIGDDGNDHTYIWGSALMDDGFRNDPCRAGDPNIDLFGRDAYQGEFDIYVYGSEDGNFTLSYYGATTTKHISGGFDGNFVENQNYVIFPAVDINDPYSGSIVMYYSNVINGLQLVSTKQPKPVQNGTNIYAMQYDVAYETNARSGEGQHFGPDGSDPCVFWLDAGEYMEYDITVDGDANKGYYSIVGYCDTGSGNVFDDLAIYLDDLFLGTLAQDDATDGEYWVTDNSVSTNLFEGSHTFKWAVGGSYGHNIQRFVFTRESDLVMNDCNDVYKYGLEYASDYTGDCHVDYNDLALALNYWLDCYSPDANDCP